MEQKFKPFDLGAAKAGAPVMTCDGRPARILAFDLKAEGFPIVAAVKTPDGKYEAIQTYTESGEYNYIVAKHDYDLVMAPVKHRAWVNIFKDNQYRSSQYRTGDIFDTEVEAIKNGERVSAYITTVPVEWEE